MNPGRLLLNDKKEACSFIGVVNVFVVAQFIGRSKDADKSASYKALALRKAGLLE